MLAKKSIFFSQALFLSYPQFLNNTKTPDYTLVGAKSGVTLVNH